MMSQEWFNRRYIAYMAFDKAVWRTVKPNGLENKGRPVMIDDQTGEVVAGIGGELNGKKLSEIKRKGTTATPAQEQFNMKGLHNLCEKGKDLEREMLRAQAERRLANVETAYQRSRNEITSEFNADSSPLLSGYEEGIKKFAQKRDFTRSAGENTPEITMADVELFRKTLLNVFANNNFCMRMDQARLPALLNSGRFKNTHEVGKDENYKELRRESSAKLYKCADTNKIPASEMERFGYISSTPEEDFEYNTADGYGKILITFKRKNVANRTTFTLGDSLLAVDDKNTYMSDKVSDPQLVGTEKKRIMQYILKLKSAMIDGTFDTTRNNAYDFMEKIGLNVEGAKYIELQYHGALTLEDVESVSYNKFDQIIDGETMKALDLLRQRGIKVNAIIPKK